jgi:RNA polymerase sigma factor (sigma-70 family)
MNTASPAARALAELLQKIARGDQPALTELYNLTSAKLFGVCLRICEERGEAEEVLQETYVTVWRRAGTYDPAKAAAITWLVAVARNKALDRRRTGKVRQLSAPLDEAVAVSDGAPSAQSMIEDAQQRDGLMHCLEELDGNQRDSIRSAFLDGLTYEDLAHRRDVPLGTMKSWIRRGLKKLKGCLER